MEKYQVKTKVFGYVLTQEVRGMDEDHAIFAARILSGLRIREAKYADIEVIEEKKIEKELIA